VSQNLCCTVERIFKHKIKCYYCPPIVIPPFAPDFNRKQNQAIFIGRHTKEKGAHLLSEVDHILRRKGIAIKWLLITSGKFDEKIRNKNLEWEDNCDGVQVLENLTNSNIFSHLESSTFFILPSIAEGFPVSLIEAYSQGCIPIVFRYGKDVTNHIPCEFHENIIEDGSALGIAQRIEEILVNDSIHGFYEISQDWFKSNHTLNSDNLHKLTLCGREKRLKSPLKFFAYQVMRKIFEPSKENPRNSWF
jgi:glycosyltransferase involved in cell wall biosynthesis